MFDASLVMKPEFRQRSRAELWQDILTSYDLDEDLCLQQLMELARPSAAELEQTETTATQLIRQVRGEDESVHMLDALLQEYSLDTEEGVLLMSLAEALMRVPDKATADALIRDKMAGADWQRHMGRSQSLLVNASTWGLRLTGKLVQIDPSIEGTAGGFWQRLANRCGEPVVRAALYRAMAVLGRQFVLGRTIEEALHNARQQRAQGYTHSFDMLGEAAMTQADARRYYDEYRHAIEAIGFAPADEQLQYAQQPRPALSIKLSALHPRYERAQQERVLTELVSGLVALVQLARTHHVPLTIDAEETNRLELSLEVFRTLYESPAAQGWGQLGLAVQAYSKRALPVLAWLTQLAREQGDEIPVRLVKGAYWDTEIKLAQQLGLASYPVFTRKEGTDTSYLACMRFLLSEQTRGALYPQFATHNAHTVASALTLAAGTGRAFEFQRLHGMGNGLYNNLLGQVQVPVRIYAPVGAHQDLLPYLVRRLLENGANSSFVHRLLDARTPVEDLVRHPVPAVQALPSLHNDRIPLPGQLFQPQRLNSAGLNLAVLSHLLPLQRDLRALDAQQWTGAAMVAGSKRLDGVAQPRFSPQDRRRSVGVVHWTSTEAAQAALKAATEGFAAWSERSVAERAAAIEAFAELLEQQRAELMALCCREAGKTLQDSLDEVREAVDFCRYYAAQARTLLSEPVQLQGPTGESNELYYEGRGVFLCISPWNFPLAIFVGQSVAALAAGNAVIAKPAEQTSLIATRAVELMWQAGIPGNAMQMLPGDGAELGAVLLADERTAGVAFTGSTATAQAINRQLAARSGAIVPLIAETGGQNAMIVDSTALPEQVVRDVLQSGFSSAGQRCSALRVLYVQQEVAERVEQLLAGAMAELCVGDPCHYATDVGPVIDEQARECLQAHVESLRDRCRLIGETALSGDCAWGCFLAPVAFEIGGIEELEQENFGPVLHLVRCRSDQLDAVIAAINRAGYGLTLGIHSRSATTAAYIERRVKVGNTYINRNQVGAVVGVQPFGGRGLSGTGPKAGGPNYLLRFMTERVRTLNTSAVGGDSVLLSQRN